ncbi:MAG: DUF190 domain-containing protein [Candidatus Marinimicrobia bacterium]|nr:DUF190 domain-containing protein [Candidatus Neomarinimicrobiota bacterium]
MKEQQKGVLVRIFITEDEKYNHKPLFEEIVKKAHELKLAGATVLRGIMGYGSDSRIHSAKFVRLNEDLPVVIEIVDCQENIDKILPFLDEAVTSGLITIENIAVLKYGNQSRQNQ